VFAAAATPPEDRYASSFGVTVAGALAFLMAALLASALINLWPVVDPPVAATVNPSAAVTEAVHHVTFAWGLFSVRVTRSTALLLLAMNMGAIGGYVHAATSFVSYIGNRQFKASWGWWYALRTTIGAALALMIYVAFRAGFLTTSGSGADAQIDPYGVAAVSALAGLFSKQATDKLEEIFNTAFRTAHEAGDATRGDKLKPGSPIITRLDPEMLPPSTAGQLVVFGSNLVDGARIAFDDAEQPSQYQTPGKLSVDITTDQFPAPRTVQVAVVNPDGERSEPRPLEIRAG
jgi:hypothetical protein